MVLGLDKKKIAQFSDILRDKLSEETKKRAAYYGILPDRIQSVDDEFEDSIVIGGKVFNRNIKHKREQLVREIKEKGYVHVMDEVTYTWFNRFVALKFMEANGYLPVKVFSSDDVGKHEPDILTKSLSLDFMDIDRNTVIELKSKGKDEELYRYLILHLCNYLNDIMPFLFEKIEDYTELLFSDKLLHTDSIFGDLNGIIKEEDWREVEVIGWIYQDYVAKKKEILIKANKQYQSCQIPTVTQLFTPKWIVKYMVQNSLGRYWLESHPNKELQNKFEFYLESKEENYLEKIKNYIDRTLSPENITFIDPAMGSGHILVYAFEVFYEVYKLSGYMDDKIPELILTKNLYGLEIDSRAAQLASFALLMKARQYDKRLFEKKIELNIVVIKETNNLTIQDIRLFAGNDSDYAKVEKIFDLFKDAKTYGSIIKINEFDYEFFKKKLDEFEKSTNLRKYVIIDELKAIIKQTKIMAKKYDVAVTNPPYVYRRRMPELLKKYLITNYPNTKYDLFSTFIDVMLNLSKKNAQLGLMTPFVWMFIQSYEDIRKYIIENKNISSLVQLEFSSFEDATVPICTFTLRNYKSNTSGEYIRLSDFKGSENQPRKLLDAISNNVDYRYTSDSKNYRNIPGKPIAYWISDKIGTIFSENCNASDFLDLKAGLSTGDNKKYQRNWHEVGIKKIGFNYDNLEQTTHSMHKWYPCNSGGEYRKWYGNNDIIINWESNGKDLKMFPGSALRNQRYYFKEGITWTKLGGSKLGIRFKNNGFIFDDTGRSAFSIDTNLNLYLLSFLCSKIPVFFASFLNPSLSLTNEDIARFPIIVPDSEETKSYIEYLTQSCIDISHEEWDSREMSWDFKTNELLRHTKSGRLKNAYDSYCSYWKDKFQKLHANEEELNRIFIDIYDLADEMTPDIALGDVTILKDESKIEDGEIVFIKEVIVKQFISYAVGCMFGRYSPDKPGLILANQGETIKDFREKVPDASFMPDDDNIIPILDDDYFTDDIVGRFKEFLKITFGAEALSENLDFIAGALSKSKKSNASPEKVIRDYFLKDFFKDHVRMYKKRPIYWLFTSGKGRGFNALVYMHRYNRETLAKMRTDYLLELEAKLDARIGMLGDGAGVEKGRLGKQVAELVAYDEKLNHKSLQLIEIDLDDGVKVNYAKFEGLVEKI